MKKDKKVINLFDHIHKEEDDSKKYSVALKDLVKSFDGRFPKDYTIEDVLEFSVNSWNMANLNVLLPHDEFGKFLELNSFPEPEKTIFKQMIHAKNENFQHLDRFIMDFDFREKGGVSKLKVLTQDKESFLSDMMDNFEEEPPYDYEEAYINRSALVLRPKPPFLDWLKSLGIEFEDSDVQESNTYLLDESIDDLDKWLQKKFDIFFKMELDEWHSIKKEWPMKRTYKMFEEWFFISLSTVVYDMVREPIYKNI